ncbi:hypothetical protein N185_36760 [Sinorhizobium sp. GW3]|nr:hypothetical protein N185_36760 [Sinorhizobium sp. GW3]
MSFFRLFADDPEHFVKPLDILLQQGLRANDVRLVRSSVVVVKPPPLVWISLRTAGRHVLPGFLSAKWREVQERKDRTDRFTRSQSIMFSP